MRTSVIVGLLFLWLAAQAAVPFADAFQQMSVYTTAQAEVVDAQQAITLAEKNPALPPQTVTLARQRALLANSKRYYAALLAKSEQMALFAAVLQTRDQSAIDDVNTTQNDVAVQVATIRQQNGSITVQEMMKATDSLTRASIDAANTRYQLTLALAKLQAVSAEPAAPLALPPALEVSALSIQGLPSLLEANAAVVAAELAVTLAHGSDTAAVDLQARERELNLAQENVKTVTVQETRALDTAKQQYQSATTIMADCDRSLAAAQKALVMLETQYKSGLASKMTYLDGLNIVNNALLARDTALLALWHAYYTLLLSSGAPHIAG